MKRINKNKRKQYRALRLTFDDIKEIFIILQDNKNEGDEIIVRIGDYELESVDEISDLRDEKFSEVNISLGILGYGSYSFHMSSSLGIAECDTSNLTNLGIFQKIDEILISNQRKVFAFLCSSVWTLLLFGMVISSLLGLLLKSWIFIVITIMFSSLLINPLCEFLGKNMLYKGNESSFFKRNKDGIKVGILVGIFTTVCTVLIEIIKFVIQR
ncbi:hypothetical protein [Brevibacillus laterosporus]|uniref:hypothetical protein n=1 Tax=Brevibacillus laterosporus TaxID=1465 RepID=UPI000CE4F848|nr:hypothetical protein [Brevibacillus laterosporus]